MAKTRLTTSEISLNNCFIRVEGKASLKLSQGTVDGDEEYDGSDVEPSVEATFSSAKNSVRKTSEILTVPVPVPVPVPEAGTERKGSLEETEDDGNNSDYGAESFCSEDSYKGSEVTNVTPRSSTSGGSSFPNSHSTGNNFKYDKRITDLIENRKNVQVDETGSSTLGESEMRYLSEDEETSITNGRRLTRSGRRNMSFTNDQLRRIERENHLLLKKIMSHQKPQGRGVKPNSGPPRTSSSALNRRRQQRKIEEDNMMLLRRIQQAKPCAMPRTSAPNCRLATI